MSDSSVETSNRRKLYDVDGFKAETGLPAWRIYSEHAAGKLAGRRVGRRLFFTQADIDEYLARIKSGGTETAKLAPPDDTGTKGRAR